MLSATSGTGVLEGVDNGAANCEGLGAMAMRGLVEDVVDWEEVLVLTTSLLL